MIEILSVGAGIIIFICSILLFRRTHAASMIRENSIWWLVLVIFIVFFLIGYVLFEYFLLTGIELFNNKFVVSQVFMWGAVFVLICARLFHNTTSGMNYLFGQRCNFENELKESEEKYRSLVESTEDSIYMLDKDCKYIFMNQKHMMRLGLNDYRNLVYDDYHMPQETARVKSILAHVFETGRPEKNEHEIGGKWFLQTMSPVKDPGSGKVTAVTVISTDITTLKKAEDIRLENKRLAETSRAKSEFLATMSHELRTPLNAIMGFSELLRMGDYGGMNMKQKHFIDNIIESGKFLLSLINDILDLSKVEAGKIVLCIEKTSVPAIMNETLKLVKERASSHKVILKQELDQRVDFIEVDRQRLKQILFNLLSNAVKFSKPEGGTIMVAIKKEGDTARFSVSDTGIGIKNENIGKLFNAFEQLDYGITKNYGGTGLGLAITKKLVELHGGTINVESRYGEGSTFTFFLPLVAKKIGEI